MLSRKQDKWLNHPEKVVNIFPIVCEQVQNLITCDLWTLSIYVRVYFVKSANSVRRSCQNTERTEKIFDRHHRYVNKWGRLQLLTVTVHLAFYSFLYVYNSFLLKSMIWLKLVHTLNSKEMTYNKRPLCGLTIVNLTFGLVKLKESLLLTY